MGGRPLSRVPGAAAVAVLALLLVSTTPASGQGSAALSDGDTVDLAGDGFLEVTEVTRVERDAGEVVARVPCPGGGSETGSYEVTGGHRSVLLDESESPPGLDTGEVVSSLSSALNREWREERTVTRGISAAPGEEARLVAEKTELLVVEGYVMKRGFSGQIGSYPQGAVGQFKITYPGNVSWRVEHENCTDTEGTGTVGVPGGVVEVDPGRTYLRTSEDGAPGSLPITLSEYGVEPGDTVTLERIGTWDPNAPDGHRGRGVIGVFSGTGELLEPGTRHRVRGAIDAGSDVATDPTFRNERPTDIPEDFAIADPGGEMTSVTVTVPPGATHLFVAANDVLYEDNSDTFAVRIVEEDSSVLSTFESGTDGWSVTSSEGGTFEPRHRDGWLSMDDPLEGIWYWQAPPKFLGEKSDYYGGTLSFALRQSNEADQFEEDDVILEGDGVRLVYDLPEPPGTEWTTYEVPLEEGPGWSDGEGGSVDPGGMRAVLSDLSRLQIRGEYRTGDDTGGIDSVIMVPGDDSGPMPTQTATPGPGSVFAGLALLAAYLLSKREGLR